MQTKIGFGLVVVGLLLGYFVHQYCGAISFVGLGVAGWGKGKLPFME